MDEVKNRIKFFESGKKIYMYDAFSQNIYPVNKKVRDFFKNANSNSHKSLDKEIQDILTQLSKWNGKANKIVRLPETHLTINFSNKCNLNCSYCYRNKENKNVMTFDKALAVLDYTDKYFKTNNDEIIFSLDMTAEAFFDYDKIVAFDDKLAEYENLYLDESDVISISISDFLEKIKEDLFINTNMEFTGSDKENLNKIIMDQNLFSYFNDKKKVNEILNKGNYNPKYLDKKRLLRLNRELLETFYPNILKHKDYQKYRIWFMSNGTNITNKEIELIKKIHIDPFWISLDGPEVVHNKNRKYYDNKGSHEDVIQNIKLLQKNDINVKISCVLTSDFPCPDKLYSYFKMLDVVAMQMCPVRNGNINSFTEKNIEQLKKGYKRLFDILLSEVLNNDFKCFSLLNEDLSMIALSNLFQRIRQNGRCTWGNEIILDSKGDIYPCLYVIGQEEYLLGNIDEKKSAKELLKPITLAEMDQCPTCWARYLCGGTCHYNSLVSNKNIYKVDEIECCIRKFVISESISFLIQLIENNIDIKSISTFFC